VTGIRLEKRLGEIHWSDSALLGSYVNLFGCSIPSRLGA
jgi:hypothetical protein